MSRCSSPRRSWRLKVLLRTLQNLLRTEPRSTLDIPSTLWRSSSTTLLQSRTESDSGRFPLTNPRRTAPYWLAPAVPALALFLAVYVPSLAILVVLSFFKFVPGQLPVPGLTLANYGRFILDPYYLGLMLNTLYLAAVASVIAVALSYPLAYSLVRSPGLRRIILPAVTISFF